MRVEFINTGLPLSTTGFEPCDMVGGQGSCSKECWEIASSHGSPGGAVFHATWRGRHPHRSLLAERMRSIQGHHPERWNLSLWDTQLCILRGRSTVSPTCAGLHKDAGAVPSHAAQRQVRCILTAYHKAHILVSFRTNARSAQLNFLRFRKPVSFLIEKINKY